MQILVLAKSEPKFMVKLQENMSSLQMICMYAGRAIRDFPLQKMMNKFYGTVSYGYARPRGK